MPGGDLSEEGMLSQRPPDGAETSKMAPYTAKLTQLDDDDWGWLAARVAQDDAEMALILALGDPVLDAILADLIERDDPIALLLEELAGDDFHHSGFAVARPVQQQTRAVRLAAVEEAWQAGKLSHRGAQARLARRLGCHRSTVSRALRLVRMQQCP